MPTYEYACIGCKQVTDATRPLDDRNMPLPCPICGSDAFLKMSAVSVVGSGKQWSGRDQVNFFVDDRQSIAKKQVAETINSGRFDKYCQKNKCSSQQKRAMLNSMGKMMKKAPPVKLDMS